MRFKSGVTLFGVRPELVAILSIIDSAWKNASGVEATITSITERTSRHSRASIHYSGGALDVRIRYNKDFSAYWPDNLTTKGIVPMILEDLKDSLTAEFDVVLEKDHIHIEFQPK